MYRKTSRGDGTQILIAGGSRILEREGSDGKRFTFKCMQAKFLCPIHGARGGGGVIKRDRRL